MLEQDHVGLCLDTKVLNARFYLNQLHEMTIPVLLYLIQFLFFGNMKRLKNEKDAALSILKFLSFEYLDRVIRLFIFSLNTVLIGHLV